jgi:hypothetical protein
MTLNRLTSFANPTFGARKRVMRASSSGPCIHPHHIVSPLRKIRTPGEGAQFVGFYQPWGVFLAGAPHRIAKRLFPSQTRFPPPPHLRGRSVFWSPSWRILTGKFDLNFFLFCEDLKRRPERRSSSFFLKADPTTLIQPYPSLG